jgi:hypothetical protein
MIDTTRRAISISSLVDDVGGKGGTSNPPIRGNITLYLRHGFEALGQVQVGTSPPGGADVAPAAVDPQSLVLALTLPVK